MSTDTSFTDCVISVGATTFNCHKLVLSNASDFFKRMFLGDFKESMSNQICLKDVTPTTFNIFREYVYTYEKANLCEHSTQTISELFVCGKRWLVPSIIEDCLVILTERAQSMDVDELIDLFQLGHNFENKNLINDVSSILTSKHQKDLFCDKALLLSYHAFSEYMSITSKFKSEIERYNMIAKFLEMNGFLNENESANDCSLKLNDSDVDINLSNDETNNVESECKSKKEDCFMNREKFVKDLLGHINFTKMSGSEFYEGPGKSKLLTLDKKYEILYKIQNRRINHLNIILNQYRAR